GPGVTWQDSRRAWTAKKNAELARRKAARDERRAREKAKEQAFKKEIKWGKQQLDIQEKHLRELEFLRRRHEARLEQLEKEVISERARREAAEGEVLKHIHEDVKKLKPSKSTKQGRKK